MNLLLCIVSIAFGGLSLLAALYQMRTEKRFFSAGLMMSGSLLLIAAVVCNFIKLQYDFVFALTGCAAICVAAIRNGLKRGNFHMQHHIIRVTLSLLLTIGFVLL